MITYPVLAGLVVGVGVLLALACLLARRPAAGWWLAMAATLVTLVLLTAIFDSVMIMADLFRYSAAVREGPHLGVVPLADFSWPIAVALGLPSLWRLVGGDAARPAPGAGR